MESKDYMNHRYFRKRALYLTFIASHMRKYEIVSDVKFTHHHGNHMKPVLVITPAGTEIHLFSPVAEIVIELRIWGGGELPSERLISVLKLKQRCQEMSVSLTFCRRSWETLQVSPAHNDTGWGVQIESFPCQQEQREAPMVHRLTGITDRYWCSVFERISLSVYMLPPCLTDSGKASQAVSASGRVDLSSCPTSEVLKCSHKFETSASPLRSSIVKMK